MTGDELIAFYKELIDAYPIVTIGDPYYQDDWANWTKFTGEVGDKVQIVGYDLTVTNPVKIRQAVDQGLANCLLLKVNQIRSISESIDAVKLSKQSGWGFMTSHRCSETGICTLLIWRLVCALVRSRRERRSGGRGPPSTISCSG